MISTKAVGRGEQKNEDSAKHLYSSDMMQLYLASEKMSARERYHHENTATENRDIPHICHFLHKQNFWRIRFTPKNA